MFPYPDEAFFLLPEEVVERVLVIGGGVAGMQAALDAAEAGIDVVLVEREPSLGGRAAQLEAMFPTLDHAVCDLREKMIEVLAHPLIKVHTQSEVRSLRGFGGDFTAEIRVRARKVTEKCTGCGLCSQACPVKSESEFDFGIGTRAAVYLPFPQAIPAIPTLDAQICRHFSHGCDICQAACPVQAIDFEQDDNTVTERSGAVVLASGFTPRDVTGFVSPGSEGKKTKTLNRLDPDIVSSAQLERMLSGAGPTRGEVRRPSNEKKPRSVVFLLCPGFAGSGGLDRGGGQPYCSRICCANAAKQALLLGKLYGDIQLSVVYTETRAIDRAGEALIQRVKEEYGVDYLRGRALKIDRDGENLTVVGESADGAGQWELKADMVVLGMGIGPDDGFDELAERLGVIGDSHNFVLQPAPKLQPLETTAPGLFVAGTVTGPLDISESRMQGSGAAARALAYIRKLSRYMADK